jgi:hypothetical protein
VQKMEKKECFSRMHLSRSADNVEQYKVIKKIAKRPVSEARGQMYDGLYQQLGMKKGRTSIRWTKGERKMWDIIQVKCIKDETKQLLTKDEEIKNRWWEYFDKLFNENNMISFIKLDISSDDLNMHFVCGI